MSRYQSMLPVLENASVHNVELVKFFFKLLYQADNRRSDPGGNYEFRFIKYNVNTFDKCSLCILEISL